MTQKNIIELQLQINDLRIFCKMSVLAKKPQLFFLLYHKKANT